MFIILQTILNNRLEAVGITPDRATERAGQLCYLPNKGDYYQSFQTNSIGPFNPSVWGEDIARIQEQQESAQDDLRARQEASRVNAKQRMASGTHDVIGAYKATYDIPTALQNYGYIKNGKGWLSPNSESGNPGVTISDDGRKWFSHHGSDSGIGQNGGDGRWGDAWDLFKYYEHGNSDGTALKAAGDMFMTDSGETINHANQREFAEKKNLEMERE